MVSVVKRLQLSKRRVRELTAEAAALGYRGPQLRYVEETELRRGLLYLADGKPLFIRRGGRLAPHLTAVDEYFTLPSVIVDIGAVPHVVNGADIMAPGVMMVDGDFEEGDIVVIRDERHGKAIAVGTALVASPKLRELDRGKVVKNLHYVGDEFWEIAKELRE